MWDASSSLASAFLGSPLASYPGWLLEWPGYEARLSPSGCLIPCNATCRMWQKLGRNLRTWKQQQPTSAFIHYTFQWLLHKQTVLHKIDVFFLFVCLFFSERVRNKFTETIPGSRNSAEASRQCCLCSLSSRGHTFVFPIWQQRLGGAWVRGYPLLGNSLSPSTLYTLTTHLKVTCIKSCMWHW